MSKTATPVTADNLRAIMADGMEPAEPAGAILAYLKQRDGKKLTKRDETELKGLDPDLRITKRAGMTNIEWGGYGRTGGNQGGSLLIAYTEAAPVIDAVWIENRNTWAFAARVERNNARTHVLSHPQTADSDNVFTEAAEAINMINHYRALLESMTEYGGALHEIRSEISKMLKDG